MFPFIISGNGKESRKSVKYPSLLKHKTPYHISNPFLEWENKFVWQTLIYYWKLQLPGWSSAVWGSKTSHLYRCDCTEHTLLKCQLWLEAWCYNPGAGRNSSSRVRWEICFKCLVLWAATILLCDWCHFVWHIVLPYIFILVLQHHNSSPHLTTVQCGLDHITLNIRTHLIFWSILTQPLWNLFSPSLHGKAGALWVWTCTVLIVQGAIIHRVQQTHLGICIDLKFGTWPMLPKVSEMFH